MTEEDKLKLDAVHAYLRDERRKMDDLHNFFMVPPAPGRKARAQEIDEALMIIRTGRVMKNVIIGVCGIVIAVSAAVASIKGFQFWKW